MKETSMHIDNKDEVLPYSTVNKLILLILLIC